MESIIYVAEATALIESIHTLKQWLYDGTAQLLIPICTLHIVEEAFKASLVAKDAPKQQPPAKQTGGRARKEYPLFDINPRTAWEFIERVKSGKEVTGVTFQQENEVFTQWKNEEEKEAAKEEAALPPPSSFADALLRKLAVKEDAKETKAPAKPKLTARTKDHKPVWKIEKTPTLSAVGLTNNNKSLLSCVLWRVHEAEKNPLQPIKYQLLVNDQNVKDMAHEFGLATITTDSLKEKHLKAQHDHDIRNTKGQLEHEFPEILALSRAFVSGDDVDSNSGNFAFLDFKQSNGALDHDVDHSEPVQSSKTTDTIAILSSGLEVDLAIHENDTHEPKNEYENKDLDQLAVSQANGQSHDILQSIEQVAPSAMPSETIHSPDREAKQEAQFDSDLESDEEIIVFNPRNRRGSGPLNSRSRPGSSGSFVTKIYKAGIPTTSNLVFPPTPTINDQTVMRDMGDDITAANSSMQLLNDSSMAAPLPSLSVKSPMESKLKAESPVFTPGKPILSGLASTSTTVAPLSNPNVSGPLPPTGPRNTGSRHQRGGILPKPDNHELLRMQKESSHRMIQRQREAIQRQSKAAEGLQAAFVPSSPRLIQMEPTDNPTVIDPDAFDRTYIVQPPSSPANTTQRQGGQRRHGRGNHHRNAAKDRSKQNGQAAESTPDSALGTDTPRGSTRGRGKLWVP